MSNTAFATETSTYHVTGNGEPEVYDSEERAIAVAASYATERGPDAEPVAVTRLTVSGTYRSTQIVWPDRGPIHSN